MGGVKNFLKGICTWEYPKNTISINKFEKRGLVLDVKLAYNHGKNMWNNELFTCEIIQYGKSSISAFQQFFASIDKVLILWGRLSTRL